MNINTEKTKIYILSGKARSGKDTTADIIKKHYEEKNKKVIILSYGYYIKHYAKKISNWDGSDEAKPRTLLQNLGTDIIRNNIDDMFFIKRMIGDIYVYSYFFDVIIISDARFKKEITTIKDEFDDVIDIHITRPNFDNGLNDNEQNHPSEQGLNGYNDYSYVIKNDSTIEELEIKVINIIEEVENER